MGNTIRITSKREGALKKWSIVHGLSTVDYPKGMPFPGNPLDWHGLKSIFYGHDVGCWNPNIIII